MANSWNDWRVVHSFLLAKIGQYVRLQLEDGMVYEGEIMSKEWEGFVTGYLIGIKPENKKLTTVLPVIDICLWERIPRESESAQLLLFGEQTVFVFF